MSIFTMVFKPLSHLARRSTKAFAHGYAQSLAAASQSSYASTNTPFGQLNSHRFANKGTSTRREANYITATSTAPAASRSGLTSPPYDLHTESGLDFFASVRQRHHREEEWQPIQL